MAAKLGLLGRLREVVFDAHARALCVTKPVSIAYLTGFHVEPHERLVALVVLPDSAVLVVPRLEAEAATAAVPGVEVAAWDDGEDPLDLLLRLVGSPPVLLVEKDHLTVGRAERLGAGRLEDAAPALAAMRGVKSDEELDLLREAARRTDAVTAHVSRRLRPGMSELEAAAEIDALIRGEGCTPAFATIVQSGPNSALPHLSPTDRRFQPGDLVLLDFGCRWRGYCADTTRMAVVGPPTPRQLELHALVMAANQAGRAAIRPGARTGDVDAAARRVIAAGGVAEAFIHRLGHGLGLEAHEAPNLTPGTDTELAPGNVVTVEPGVYLPGWGGIRIEDDVAVMDKGHETLTSADRSFIVVDAARAG